MHIELAGVIRGLHQQPRIAVEVLLCRGGVIDVRICSALDERCTHPFWEGDIRQRCFLVVDRPTITTRGASEHVEVAVLLVDHHYGPCMIVTYSAEDVV